ncbi:MAG: AsmA-like C-terminal region-containing protein [Candidatus Saelkia tenebricola]|nr:AsmA-like C-terminal region-containing protein [Candidatus Saelkia tenebricola]
MNLILIDYLISGILDTMKKYLFLMLLVLIFIIGTGYFIAQRYLLPIVISKLEENITKNTLFKAKIDQPIFKLTTVIIPQIEAGYDEKLFFIKNLQLNPSLLSIAQRGIRIKGKGIIVVEKNELHFEIKNFLYKQKTNELKLQIYFPSTQAKSYFDAAAYMGNVNLKNLKDITGEATLLLDFMKIAQPELKLILTTDNISLNYQGNHINIPILKTSYQKFNATQELQIMAEDCSLKLPYKDDHILEQCSFVLQSDFKKISFDKFKAKTNNFIWEGNLEISDLKNNPTGSFNLRSELCNARGKINRIKNIFNFDANLSKEKTSLYLKGNYNLENQMLSASGTGNTDIKTVASYFNPPEESLLNALDADLKIENYNLSYEKNKNSLSGHLDVDINRLTIDQYLFADKGTLTVEIQNKNLELKNLSLISNYGNIQSKGNLILQNKNSFQAEIYLKNYEFKKLTQPFLGKDIGNALVTANCSIQGNLKEQDSILGICKWEFIKGNVGKLKFLSQIARLINRPELEEISFNQGQGAITFKNNTFNTPDSTLVSPHLNLAIVGSMHTNGNLNITLTTEFPQKEPATKSDSLFGKFEEILSASTGESFYKIQITGNIEKPKYTIVPNINKIFQKILQ